MPEDKDSTRQLLLRQLKLNPLRHSATVSRLMSLFEGRVRGGQKYSEINAELRALEYLQEQAISIAQQSYPLVCDADGKPKFTISCDPYTLALKLELTIDPNS